MENFYGKSKFLFINFKNYRKKILIFINRFYHHPFKNILKYMYFFSSKIIKIKNIIKTKKNFKIKNIKLNY